MKADGNEPRERQRRTDACSSKMRDTQGID